MERWTTQETECDTGGISKNKVEEREGVMEGGRLMKWASQIKADMAEEREGRLQKTLMSQPFVQTTLLQPCTKDNAHEHMPMHCTDGRRAGRVELPGLASHSVNGDQC